MNIYRPQRSCWKENVFTPVCDSVYRGCSCPRGVSVQGVSVQEGGLCSGGLCSGVVSVQGVSVQGVLCPEGVSVRETPPPASMVICRQCASYWNAFLFNKVILQIVKSSVSIPMIDIKLRALNRWLHIYLNNAKSVHELSSTNTVRKKRRTDD